MSEDDESESNRSSSGNWLRQIGMSLAGPPRDRDELVAVLTEAQENELLDVDALWMMQGVLKVSELQVRDIMIPRSQMVVVESDADIAEVLATAIQSGHSRFPVIGESRDEVAGILLAKDMLQLAESPGGRAEFEIGDVLRSAVYVPESKRVNVLLKEFKASRNHMAIVVDEYGGVAGLVTIEDALEQIVGDIDDEYDQAEGAYILRQEKNRFQVRSLTPVDEFNKYFDTDFSDEDFDTIGGLVVHEFGHMPKRGETTTIDRFQFNVQRADSRRIHLFQMTILPEAAE
ncbi:magnesium transporter [Salinisphaera orenii MK-B5]|uniref:Magnesium and cobalt efflux protein CorC n=2 Tax=Salinisphaera orenii TaxID=856731 RepID=A0A423PNZ0_9GAMM|nr:MULTISPECIES: transporter associated domain-containing protein [Salinisphaera]ROO27278.1 magnesium transporter [Salinisphaera orenii MK-B5]ROO37616.1 magnesium transporter [Salinisphaera halophila YIM 95161]